MGHGDSGTTVGATGGGIRTAEALRGWHDLNMAVARSLPTSLLRAGQYHRAALLALRHRARVK
jgi:hypothetical protein